MRMADEDFPIVYEDYTEALKRSLLSVKTGPTGRLSSALVEKSPWTRRQYPKMGARSRVGHEQPKI